MLFALRTLTGAESTNTQIICARPGGCLPDRFSGHGAHAPATRQRQQIQQLVREELDEAASVLLFGSRLEDQCKGGDIDLLSESTHRIPRLQQASLKLELEVALQLPVDLVFHQSGQPLAPFQAIAKVQAQPLA